MFVEDRVRFSFDVQDANCVFRQRIGEQQDHVCGRFDPHTQTAGRSRPDGTTAEGIQRSEANL